VPEAFSLVGAEDAQLVDLRDRSKRERHGVIPGSVHAPYPDIKENVSPGGMLHQLSKATGRKPVFYCAYGERSGMAVQAAHAHGSDDACHIRGGMDAWNKENGPVE
jgi:rhodanese-related sulfurtransferase